MNQKITALGGDLHSGNIRCLSCMDGRGGGFDPNYGILLCANRPEPVEDSLAHGDFTDDFDQKHLLTSGRDGTRLRFFTFQGQFREQ